MSSEGKHERLENLGPLTLKVIAFLAGIAVFVPLLTAFAAPFIG